MFGLEVQDGGTNTEAIADAARMQLFVRSKPERDAAIYRFFGRYLLSPLPLLSLAAFLIGLWTPAFAQAVRDTLPESVLAGIAGSRAAATSFKDAAFVYWLVAIPTLPFCLFYMNRLSRRFHLHAALFALARVNLMTGTWNPGRWTFRGGRLRFAGGLLMGLLLIAVLLLVNGEPSYCKGCETSSVVGFVLINWAGLHLLLMFTYWIAVYFDNWKAIRGQGGNQ